MPIAVPPVSWPRRQRLDPVGGGYLDKQGRRAAFFTLPMPPSANNMFINTGRGRARSEAYNAWINEAGWELRRQRVPKLKGRVRVNIRLERPSVGKADVDNRIKPVLDLLQTMGVLTDDSLVWDVRAVWAAQNSGKKTVQGARVGVVEMDAPVDAAAPKK
ncbi:MAG: RusA family crossover junction endodeoxyribonuclease [Pseudomonadota bacterium]